MQLITNLQRFVETDCEHLSIQLLPICHTTNTKNGLVEILESGFLQPKKCAHYGEDLLYFFYGKAKYYPNEDLTNGFDQYASPFTFLYEINSLPSLPYRMVPFDSGGFSRYNIQHIPKERFSIEKIQLKHIRWYVTQVYETNENYLENTVKLKAEDFPYCKELSEIVALHSSSIVGKAPQFGSQALTIEIQYRNQPIPLTPKVVFCPNSYLATPAAEQQTKIAFPGAKIVPYGDHTLTSFQEYAMMDKAVLDYIKTRNLQ